MRNTKRACIAVFASSFVLGVSAIGFPTQTVKADTNAVNVQVNIKESVGTIPAAAIGVNTATWDSNLLNKDVPSLVRNAGVSMLRFPGGSTSDIYHWQTNSYTPGNGSNPPEDFDDFMTLVRTSHTQAMITVNYGSNTMGTAGGDPMEAAAWVAYAKAHHDNVHYWTVGNEVYGNGYYNGSAWEEDLHTDHSPTTYATNLLTYIKDMKSADPTVQIGAVLTAPGNWPDASTIQGATVSYPDGKDPVNEPPQPWNPTVLKIAGSKIDYVDVHWYPQNPPDENDATLLSSTSQIAGMVSSLRKEIDQYCGKNASHIKIMITETNSVAYNPGKQTTSTTNALFLADDYMTWLENGVANVDWWDLHNGIVTGQGISTGDNLYGTTQYGDYGLLSSGESGQDAAGETVSEPPVDTPMTSYYGLQMLTKLGHPGDKMVRVTSDQSLITVHAVKQKGGKLAVLIINKDPNNSYMLDLQTPDFHAYGDTAKVYTYGKNSTKIAAMRENVNHIMLKPYSLTTVVLG